MPVVALAVLLVTAGCAGNVSDLASASPADHAAGTIQVGANGQAQAEPDQAVVRVAVVVIADDAQTAREQLAANVSRMRAALADAGITEDQIRTSQYSIYQYHEPRTPDSTDAAPRFRAVHAFEITLSNIDRTGEIIDTAVGNGATTVNGVQFTLSEETRRSVRQAALKDAMSSARSQADAIAESGRLTITGVSHVQTSDVGTPPVPYVREAASSGAPTKTVIESGPVTVSATVQVTYNATA